MTVFILPTKSPIKYRGKRGTFPRHLSYSASHGMHVELLNGTRLWSLQYFEAHMGDLADVLESAVPMSDAQYSAMLGAVNDYRAAIAWNKTSREARQTAAKSLRAALAAIFAPAPYKFLIFVHADGRKALCEGGVYSDSIPHGADYDHNTINAADTECAALNGRSSSDGRYHVVDSMEGVTVDSTVRSSLENWQIKAVKAGDWLIPLGLCAES